MKIIKLIELTLSPCYIIPLWNYYRTITYFTSAKNLSKKIMPILGTVHPIWAPPTLILAILGAYRN